MRQDDGIMAEFEQEAHSFVIRLWPELQETAEEAAVWRGWVEHVQTGRRHYFQDIQGLHTAVGHYIEGIPDLNTMFTGLENDC